MQKALYTIILILFVSIQSNGQIVAPFANYSDTAKYAITNGPDSLFLFNVENDSTFIMVDTQNYKGFSIQWEEYQHAVGFTPIAGGEKIYFTPDSIAKGFRLTLTKLPDTFVARCWVVKNDFEIKITSKDFGDSLWTNSYLNCDRLDLIYLRRKEAKLTYYNPQTFDTLMYEVKYTSEWEKEKDVLEGRMVKVRQEGEIIRHRIVEPYWEGMWYTNVTTDDAGLERRDSMYVRSIVPKAEFTAVHIKLDDKDFYPGKSDRYYDDIYGDDYGNISAPAKYWFISTSKNAQDYFWNFADRTPIMTTTKDSVLHTYNYWGEFEPYLVAKHTFSLINKECTDTLKVETPLSIEAPQLKAPNAFSPPNGDTPFWRFSDVTISTFEIYIFSRYGKKVHEFKGEIRNWDGWDGKYKNSDSYVSTGVYYYVVKKYSYKDNIVPEENKDVEWSSEGDNTQYRGFIHVFNTNQ